MPVKFTMNEPILMTWLLCRQTHNLLSKCENRVLAEIGLTPEQQAALNAIKFIDGPVKPTEVAEWLDRSPNSITLIIDRMEKRGLVKRIRDHEDRRSVLLIMTENGSEILNQANILTG